MKTLLIILFGYLGFSTIYYLYFSVLSNFRKISKFSEPGKFPKMAVFIPAYKEDGVILDTVRKALTVSYPSEAFDIVVIADSLQPKTLEDLRRENAIVVEVSFEKSTKTKALNEAMRRLDPIYEIAVVLDADNIMSNDFLHRVALGHLEGKQVMQGQRIAKNNETPMAVLDGISEGINNSIFRKGHQVSGLSSALIGSGMAFDYSLFKNYMERIKAIGGFDKELELALLRDGIRMHYLEEAVVLDEKVSNSEVFANQRTRWIAAQIRYGIGSFGGAVKQLVLKGNVDYFNKSLQFVMPPRVILLGLLTVAFFVSLIVQDVTWIMAWGSAWIGYVLALALAIPRSFSIRQIFAVVAHVPKAFFLMLRSILGYKKAKSSFLHTPHQISQ